MSIGVRLQIGVPLMCETAQRVRVGGAQPIVLECAGRPPIVPVATSTPAAETPPLIGAPELVTHNGVVVTHNGSAVYVLV